MDAVIQDAFGAKYGLLDVGGRPLIGRQIQWLRSIGCTKIVVQVGVGEHADAIAAWIEREEILGPDLVIALSPETRDVRAVATRAGLDTKNPILVVPSDVLGDGDFGEIFTFAAAEEVIAHAQAPAGLGLTAGEIRLIGNGTGVFSVDLKGHLVRLRSAGDAWKLALAVLERDQSAAVGAFKLPIHAREVRPRVWVARGAQIDEKANLTAPVLIGPFAVIEAGATVGPCAIVGAHAVIGAGATVRDALVDENVVIGEGVAVEGVIARPGVLAPIAWMDDERDEIAIDDPLLVGARETKSRTIASRVAAALLLLATPLFVVLRWIGAHTPTPRALVDVVRGKRALVGVARLEATSADGSRALRAQAARAPEGAFDVERALVPVDASAEDRLRARAWYAAQKSFVVDVKLLVSRSA